MGIGVLGSALERETKLLNDLRSVLRQQREAVSTEDLAGVDDTIFSAQRILRTLAEARVKRRTLLEIHGIDPDLPMDDLEEALGPKVTHELREAIRTLKSVAQKLTDDLDVNRRVLDSAIRSGDTLIRILGGGEDQDSGVYGPEAEQPAGSGDHGLIIDRQI
jgi:flagellar biosynthesis/type III secretory pathway chaperone